MTLPIAIPNLPAVLEDKVGADVAVRLAYGVIHQGKLKSITDELLVLDGKNQTGAPVHVYLHPANVLEVLDLGRLIATAPLDLSLAMNDRDRR